MQSINPRTGQLIRTYDPQDDQQIDRLLVASEAAFQHWRKSSPGDLD